MQSLVNTRRHRGTPSPRACARRGTQRELDASVFAGKHAGPTEARWQVLVASLNFHLLTDLFFHVFVFLLIFIVGSITQALLSPHHPLPATPVLPGPQPHCLCPRVMHVCMHVHWWASPRPSSPAFPLRPNTLLMLPCLGVCFGSPVYWAHSIPRVSEITH